MILFFQASMVDGRVPYLEGKTFLENDEVDLIKIACDLKSLSKNICSTTHLSIKKHDSNISGLDNEAMRENSANRLLKLRPRATFRNYVPQPFLPPEPLPLKLHKKKLHSKSEYPKDDDLREYYKRSRLVNLNDLKKQTEIQLNRINMNKNESSKRPEFRSEETFEINKYQTFTWNDLKPDTSSELHSGPKFERIKVSNKILLKFL